MSEHPNHLQRESGAGSWPRPDSSTLFPGLPISGDRQVLALGVLVGTLTFVSFMGWGPLGHWFAGSSLPSKSPNPSLVVEQKSSTNHPERTRLEASKSPTRPVASNKNTTGAAKQPNANVLGAQITAEQPQTDIEPASIAVPLPVNNAVAGLDPTVSSGLNPTIPLGAASGTETAPDSNITIKPSVAESPTLETPQKLNPTIPLGIAATDGADDSIQSVATTPTLELRVPSSPGAAFPLRSLEIDPPNSAVLVP